MGWKNNYIIEMTTNNSDLLEEIKDISNIHLIFDVLPIQKCKNTTPISASMTENIPPKCFPLIYRTFLTDMPDQSTN